MNENELYEIIGSKIRSRRKSLNMTLNDLAAQLNKSVPTISKYESGTLMVGLSDLLSLSRILRIDFFSLLPDTVSPEEHDYDRYSNHFTERLYLYWFNGEKGVIQKGVMENNNTLMKTTLYFDFEDQFNYYNCNYYYSGDIYYSDTDIISIFKNQDPPFDTMTLRLPFLSGVGKPRVGIMTCISSFYQSIAMKVAGSETPVNCDDLLRDLLRISPDELKTIKKTNFFTII